MVPEAVCTPKLSKLPALAKSSKAARRARPHAMFAEHLKEANGVFEYCDGVDARWDEDDNNEDARLRMLTAWERITESFKLPLTVQRAEHVVDTLVSTSRREMCGEHSKIVGATPTRAFAYALHRPWLREVLIREPLREPLFIPDDFVGKIFSQDLRGCAERANEGMSSCAYSMALYERQSQHDCSDATEILAGAGRAYMEALLASLQEVQSRLGELGLGEAEIRSLERAYGTSRFDAPHVFHVLRTEKALKVAFHPRPSIAPVLWQRLKLRYRLEKIALYWQERAAMRHSAPGGRDAEAGVAAFEAPEFWAA